MINTLKIATGGYLKRNSKAVLIIAVSGYLNFSTVPVPPTPQQPSGGARTAISTRQFFPYKKLKEEDELILQVVSSYLHGDPYTVENLERLKEEDNLILTAIKEIQNGIYL